MEQRFIFDTVAEAYEKARPGYPAEIFGDLAEITGVGPGGYVLEIGSGTGKATHGLAKAGYRVLGLEPGRNMAEIARRKCAAFEGVRFEVVTFEDWPEQPDTFDLVLSAQTFHWIHPAIRFSKSARVLKAGGALVIMANRPYACASPIEAQVQKAYRELAPELACKTPVGRGSRRPKELEMDLEGSGCFARAVLQEYPWRKDYTSEEWVSLLATQSDHAALPEETRRALLERIKDAIESGGGLYPIDYSTVLAVGRK